MAKKKRSKGRRRRVGGSSLLNPSSPVVKIAATAVGYLLADTINAQIDKVIPATLLPVAAAGAKPGVMDYAVPAVEAGVGAFLLFKGKPSLIKSAAGGILLGAGIKRGLRKAGVITGYQSTPVIGGRRRMSGYQDTPVIGAAPGQLQGAPDQLQGYRNAGSGMAGYNSQGSGVMGALYMDASDGNGSGVNASDR